MNRNTRKKLDRIATAEERQKKHLATQSTQEAKTRRVLKGKVPDEFGHKWDGSQYFIGADCTKCGVHAYVDDDYRYPQYALGKFGWFGGAKPSCPPEIETHNCDVSSGYPCGVVYSECSCTHTEKTDPPCVPTTTTSSS